VEYHGLHGSGDCLCQWERAIFDPPQNPHPLTDHQKFYFPVITLATPMALANLVQIRPRGASGQMDEI